MRMQALLRPMESRKHRVLLFSPPARLSATARRAGSIHSRAHTLKSHILRAVMPTIMSVMPAITFSTSALTPIRATVRVPMAPALARTAAAIHGCCKASRLQLVPAMDTVRIRVLAARRKAKRSTPAVTIIAMEVGNSIRPVSIGAPVLAGTAAQQIMTMPATA